MEVTKHGASGYRRGHRCEACKAGHREEQARRRAKVNGGPALTLVPASAAVAVPAIERGPVGNTAATVEAEIDEMADRAGFWTRECDRLQAQAMATARIVDEVIDSGKYHLVPPHQRLITQFMDALKAILLPVRIPGTRTAEDDTAAAQAEIERDFGGSLGAPDSDNPYGRFVPTTWNGNGDPADRSTWGRGGSN